MKDEQKLSQSLTDEEKAHIKEVYANMLTWEQVLTVTIRQEINILNRLFTATADSQNFEVRAYAAETGHRLSLTHDLHCRIKNKFIKHDISIAHPQLEITIKDKKPHPLCR